MDGDDLPGTDGTRRTTKVRLTTKTVRTDARLSSGTFAADRHGAEETFLDRVRGYIPVEVLAFFIFVNSMIGDDGSGEWPTVWNDMSLTADDYVALAALLVGVIGTIVYMHASFAGADGRGWRVRATVSVLAFLVWAYAVRADAYYVLEVPFAASVSGFLLGTFTLFSGLVVPVEVNTDGKRPALSSDGGPGATAVERLRGADRDDAPVSARSEGADLECDAGAVR